VSTETLSSPKNETASSPRLQTNDASSWQHERSVLISLPGDLMNRYISVALRPALPRQTDDGQWYCALDLFPGVWAQEPSPKECLDTLAEVLKEWLVLKIVDKDCDIPVVDYIDLATVSRRFPG
jgi:predicted RNase H-like HicB family nuclease